MPDEVTYLSQARDAVNDVSGMASEIDKAFARADEQAGVRAGAIRTINTMCDALQLACDLIAKEISASVVDFNQLQASDDEAELRSFFRRTANRFSDGSLALLLHDGKVCGELHALGDSFRQPFSPQSRGGVSFFESVRAFFTRSTPMSAALAGLHGGERDYLRSLTGFLAEVRDRAEKGTGVFGNLPALRQQGAELVGLMRQKRQTIQEQVWAVRAAADECIKKLH